MASIPSTPTYFLAPNCDFPPDGLIALGSIFANPKTPQRSLNHRNNQRVAVPPDELQESFKDNWEDAIKSARHAKFTLWAGFLQTILGIGVDVSTGLKQGREDLYKFRRLETKYFEPDVAYIEKSLKGEGVTAYLSATKCKKPIYMVTGFKIARGASVTGRTVTQYKGMLQAGLDAAMLTGVPVSGGPKMKLSTMKEREVTFDNSSDYVFAYRVLKIQLSKHGKVKKHKNFTKGALLDEHERTSKKEDLNERNWAIEELAAASEDLQGNDIVSDLYEDGEGNPAVIVKP